MPHSGLPDGEAVRRALEDAARADGPEHGGAESARPHRTSSMPRGRGITSSSILVRCRGHRRPRLTLARTTGDGEHTSGRPACRFTFLRDNLIGLPPPYACRTGVLRGPRPTDRVMRGPPGRSGARPRCGARSPQPFRAGTFTSPGPTPSLWHRPPHHGRSETGRACAMTGPSTAYASLASYGARSGSRSWVPHTPPSPTAAGNGSDAVEPDRRPPFVARTVLSGIGSPAARPNRRTRFVTSPVEP
jgi:hypothetical protein